MGYVQYALIKRVTGLVGRVRAGNQEACLDLWVLGHSTTSKWWRMTLKFWDEGYIQDLTLESADKH